LFQLGQDLRNPLLGLGPNFAHLDRGTTKNLNRALETSYNELPTVAIRKRDKWERADVAKLVSAYGAKDQTISRRDFAKMADVPRSTLRYWDARKNSIDAHLPIILKILAG
jgi:hypothetical protein